jgi:hypothetical protein
MTKKWFLDQAIKTYLGGLVKSKFIHATTTAAIDHTFTVSSAPLRCFQNQVETLCEFIIRGCVLSTFKD